MDLHLVGQVLAVVWIAVSLWVGGVNAFILFILLAGIGQQGERPLSIRYELGIVLFCLISGTAIATAAFDSLANIPRNIGYMLLALAPYVLVPIALRIFSRHQRN